MRRTILAAAVCLGALAGCAVIKSTDVTDASYKRHQTVSVLGWPLYSRVTDREHPAPTQLATKGDLGSQAEEIEPVEMRVEPIDSNFSFQENR